MKLTYILDTNICIYIAKQKPANVLQKFTELQVGEAGISIISYGELFYGAQKSLRSTETLAALEELMRLILPLPMPVNTGKYYGEIRHELEKQGEIIGGNDLWIAAHALALDLTLVTNNEKEFSRIKGLRLENWV